MEFLIVLAVLVVVVLVVSAPLRRDSSTPTGEPGQPEPLSPAGEHADELGELQAAREAKYREIRDAELDRDTGKLSDEDHRLLDARLRAEALEILHEIDRVTGRR